MSAPGRDPRLTPARPDLAAAALEGSVAAVRFVTGERRVVTAEIADVRRMPRADAALETQALHGEAVTLYEDREGWGWVQLESDGYVGYVSMDTLGPAQAAPTHVVAVNRTFVYPAADMKRPIVAALPIGALIAIDRLDGVFSHRVGGGFIVSSHVVPRDHVVDDFVCIAERLSHTPYLWGGKSSLGIDCSGLVQVALARAGIVAPRDTDMQQNAVGTAIEPSCRDLRRGDLMFWRGHVGIMRDAVSLIHANAHHMSVESEPLDQAVARIIAAGSGGISAIKRLASLSA